MTNVHFKSNLGLSISGFILSYDENEYDLPYRLFVRVGYDNHWIQRKLRLSREGLAEFTHLLLPEAGPKAFSEQAYTLEVLDGDNYTVLYRKDFHYTSMAFSSEWWTSFCTFGRARCTAKTEFRSCRSQVRDFQAARSAVVCPGHDPCNLLGGQTRLALKYIEVIISFNVSSLMPVAKRHKSPFFHGRIEGRWQGSRPRQAA